MVGKEPGLWGEADGGERAGRKYLRERLGEIGQEGAEPVSEQSPRVAERKLSSSPLSFLSSGCNTCNVNTVHRSQYCNPDIHRALREKQGAAESQPQASKFPPPS